MDQSTIDETLHKNEIEPAAEFCSDLSEFGDLLEAEILVQTQRSCIRGVDAPYHHVHAEPPRTGKQRLDQLAANASAAMIGSHMDGMFDGVPITRPRSPPISES